MRPVTRDRLIPAGLVVGSFLLALVQRPGTVVADTKLDLYTDPGRFLSDVLSVWTPTADLGHVFAGQYGGYLFPMAPWFAAGHALGLPMWLVHRLWLGALFALAAYGIVRLLDALSDRPRGALHLVAGVVYVVNPYVAVYADRTSVALLAYAALPWMLLCVHRGLRAPRSWLWPMAFALVLTSTGGGVNAAVTGWVILAPVLFVVYERLFGGVGAGTLRPFLVRMAVANALASAWWVVPVLVHSKYGLNFLPYTEQPGTIWSTTTMTESLRLLGFWTSYIGVGYGGVLRPFAGHGHVFLFHPPVEVATLLVPALALGGFVWTRRWRYGPWFLALTLIGLLVMTAGFPEGTPLRKGMTFTYNHVEALQFLRTTYKAGPLVAIGLACLAGGAFAELWRRVPRAPWRAAIGVGAAGLVFVAAWPLTTGRAPDRQLALPHGIPQAWHDLAYDLDRQGAGSRALSVPGQLFSFYRWGGTIDHVLTGLAEHPVATRYIVPFSDLRADDLQWATDALISQERALPGQLPPLLDLLGVGDVVLGTDGDRSRSGELGAGEAADVLAGQGLLRPPDPGAPHCEDAPLEPCPWIRGGDVVQGTAARALRLYGQRLTIDRATGRVAGPAHLPRIVDIRTPTAGIVRLLPQGPLTVVDGGAQGIVDLAGFGALHVTRPVAYAADRSAKQLRADAAAGAAFVISDSNRRQAFVAARLRNNRGYVLPANHDVSQDGVILDPFPDAGTAAQTIAEYGGVRSIFAAFSPQVTQFPEHRPFAAMDGDLGTAWLADRFIDPIRHHLDVRFLAPRDVPYIDLYPYSDARGIVHYVQVNGGPFIRVHAGWNRIALHLRHVGAISVEIPGVQRPRHLSAGGGGIRELRIPGVHVTERLRVPTLLSGALRGADLSHSSLSVLLDRFTADAPAFKTTDAGPWQAGLVADRQDPEAQLARAFTLPADRSFDASAWGRPRVGAADSALDRLAGYRGSVVADGSPRFENAPGFRASSALDGDPATAWIASWRPGEHVWLQWTTTTAHTISRLRLVPLAGVQVRRPTRVRVIVDGRATPPLPVAGDGFLALPPMRGRTVRIEVLDAAFGPGASGRDRMRRAVAIAEVEGAPVAGIPRDGPLAGRCETVAQVDGTPLRMRAEGDVGALDGGEALALTRCGEPLRLAAGPHELRGADADVVVDHLRLVSPAPAPLPFAGAPGRVVDQGGEGNGKRDGVRLDVTAPGWLVLGEGYNRGWRATCDGHDLGAPVPLEGYANAWAVKPGCRAVAFSFAPNRVVWPFYLLSLLAFLAFAALLLRHRRRMPAERRLAGPVPDADPAGPWLRGRLVAAFVATGLVVGFVFALRAGAVAAPVVTLLLWRRVPSRVLILAAALVLAVVVPVLYLVHPGQDHGGYSTYYGVTHLAAHWVGVGAFVFLALALIRTLRRARVRGVAGPGSAP